MYDVFFGQGTWNREGYSRYLAYGKCEIIALLNPATVYITCGTPQRGKSVRSCWNFCSNACMQWHQFQWLRHIKLHQLTSVYVYMLRTKLRTMLRTMLQTKLWTKLRTMLRTKYTYQLVFCPFKWQFHEVVNRHITLFLPNLHKQAQWRMLRVFHPRKYKKICNMLYSILVYVLLSALKF
jgi:hypothetical protein